MIEKIKSDLYRYGLKKLSLINLLKVFIIFPVPGLKFLIIYRVLNYFRPKSKIISAFFYLWLRRLKVKYGIDISYRTKIGYGFYIGHFGGIVIHGDSIIGNNCNISQGVTIGISNSTNSGTPTIGDNVFIGPNASIFGKITIGNNVTIGANSVITKDIPSDTTVISGKMTIISKNISKLYIQNRYNFES